MRCAGPRPKNKVCSDKEFMEAVLSREGKTFTNIVSEAKSTPNMSPRTAANYLKRLVEKGLMGLVEGFIGLEASELQDCNMPIYEYAAGNRTGSGEGTTLLGVGLPFRYCR